MQPNMQEQVDKLNSRLWPVEEVMNRLCLGRTATFALIASGELRSIKIGRRRLVSEAALCDFIARVDGQTDGAA